MIKTKKLLSIAAAFASLLCAAHAADLRGLQDDKRVLLNPDKGWYHHYYDNCLTNYLGSEESISAIPNMHHLFLRFPWKNLEPKEGQFNWALIDDIVNKWYPKGVKISLSISANETSRDPATPQWVFDAGAKFRVAKITWGGTTKEPIEDDPVFLEKLENLHKAIAARYDGKPFVVDMTLASLGNWGEGHYCATFGKSVPWAIIKKHIDLYKRCYKKSQLTIGDDWIGNNLVGDDRLAAREYIKKNKIAYRDDSILVEWHYFADCNKGTDSLLRPEFFDDIYPYAPATLELEHYHSTLKSGTWKGANGEKEGAAALRRVIKKAHCTYLGYHGNAEKYAKDNPKIIKELANKVGYWYFVNSVDFDADGDLVLEWENRGAAHAFNRYYLFAKIKGKGYEKIFPLLNADNRKWEPDTPVKETYKLPLAEIPSGDYELSIGMKTSAKKDACVIELGFNEKLRDSDGFYRIIKFKK